MSVHVPAPSSVTTRPRTLHVPEEKTATGSPEVDPTLSENAGSPKVWFGITGKLMAWVCRMVVTIQPVNDDVGWEGNASTAVLVELAGAKADTLTVNVMAG